MISKRIGFGHLLKSERTIIPIYRNPSEAMLR
jgi:hypothetical protein